MKPIHKRTLITVAGILLAVSALAGCSKSQDGQSSPNSSAGSSSTEAPVTLTYWASLNPNAATTIKNMSEVAMYDVWEQKTNVKLQFQHPAVGTEKDQLNLIVASNNLPDVMEINPNDLPGGFQKMVNDGVAIKLNDLIDKYAPNLKKRLADNPDAAKLVKSDDGSIYFIPSIAETKYSVYGGPIIRKDLLDSLGLKSPETIDDWENVLKAFKSKGVEYPFTFLFTQLNDQIPFIEQAYGIGYNFYMDNGKVKFGSIQPEFKEFLSTYQRWYKEGLIDPDFSTNDQKTLDAKVTSGKAGAFLGFNGGSLGRYTPALQKTDPNAVLVAAQYPVAKKGDTPQFTNLNSSLNTLNTIITKSNKHPVETIKFFDYIFSDEGNMLKNFGIEGKTYNMVNGKPVFTDLIMKNPDGLPVAQAMAKYFRANYPSPGMDSSDYLDQYYVMDVQKDALNVWSKYKKNAQAHVLPPLNFTADESQQLTKIMTEINTFRDEAVTKTIMGAASVEDYDKTIDQIKKMNIDKAIQIYQAALDRLNARK